MRCKDKLNVKKTKECGVVTKIGNAVNPIEWTKMEYITSFTERSEHSLLTFTKTLKHI